MAPSAGPGKERHTRTASRQLARLQATLTRMGIALDSEPVIRSCGANEKWCYRCDVAVLDDELEPAQIDRIERAFARYPQSMIDAADLKHVALCHSIRMGAFGHEAEPWRSPTGLAIAEQQRIMVSIEPLVVFKGLFGDNVIERGVHHELFHLFDVHELGPRAAADDAWLAVNPYDFVYGADVDDDPLRGFVSQYATKDQHEDRASTYEHLMEEQAELCMLVADDPILAAKTAIVWNRVARVAGEDLLPNRAPCAGWPGWVDR